MSGIATLRRRPEFLAVAASGKKWAAPGMVLQIGAPRETSSPARFGLTASSKVGGAVIRNRARRRLRALAVEILPKHAESSRDYVLIARAATATRTFADLRQDLVTALQKLGAWRE